jgi:hypothetical protein
MSKKVVFILLFINTFFNLSPLKAEDKISWRKNGIPWNDYKASGNLINGRIIPPGKDNPEQLEITGPGYIPFLRFKNGTITSPHFNWMGKVRCEGVEGIGYMELRVKDVNKRVYVQTVPGGGHMSPLQLQGNMGWTLFYMPFNMPLNMKPGPEEVQISVVLPKAGKVFLTPVDEIHRHREEVFWAVKPKEKRLGDLHLYGWLIAGVLGIFLLAGLLVQKGKAKLLIFIFLFFTFFIGVVLSISGLIGLFHSGDWWVAGPTLALGGIQLVVPLILFFVSRKYYRKKS